MAKRNVQGVCKLCGKTAILCKSHYLGRSFYKLCKPGNRNPTVLTPDVTTNTPRQMWCHLLCSQCEHRFKVLGEDPVLKLVNGRDRFPLLECMQVSPNIGNEGPVIKFSGLEMGVDTEPIGYFVLSLLWRGSVTKWKTLRGQATYISLGENEEPIRKYLNGESGYPADVCVVATACTDSVSQKWLLAPWAVDERRFDKFELLIRGIWFHVAISTGPPLGMNDLCCVNSSKHVLFQRSCEQDIVDAVAHFRDQATSRTHHS
jgi:hypothetical protein